MNHRSRFLAAMLAVAIIAFLTGTGTARAGVPWACAATTITNFTACTIPLTLVAAPPAAIVRVNLGPGAIAQVPTGGIASFDFVISNGGIWYPVLAPPPVPPCNCPPANWSVCCVTLAPGCCCDVCFDPANCRITVRPAACVGPCNP